MNKESKGWELAQAAGARLGKLLEVKSIVTLVMTFALVALLFSDREPAKELLALYCTSYGAIVTYFFTRPSGGGSGPTAPAVVSKLDTEQEGGGGNG